MKTNLLVTTSLLASLLTACGTSSSDTTTANATSGTQVSSLVINVNSEAVAVGTTGTGLALTGSESSVVAINAEGKILDNLLSVDDEHFQLLKVLPAGNGVIMYATMPQISKLENDGSYSVTKYDAKLPNGKMLMEDCAGHIRILNKEVSWLLKDGTKAADFFSVDRNYKTDKLGNLFYGEDYVSKIDTEGNVSDVIVVERNALTFLGLTEDSSAVVSISTGNSTIIRLITLEGAAKTLSTNSYAMIAGNFVQTWNGLYTSKGVKLSVDVSQVDLLNMTAVGTQLYGVDRNNKLVQIDTENGTVTSTALNLTSDIYASVVAGENNDQIYVATLDGVSQINLGSSSLRLTAAATTPAVPKVEGLDGVSIFSMAKVGSKVIFAGQNDNTLGYTTGAISGDEATQNDAEVKISGIQAL